MFLYLCRESPGMFGEGGALPTIATQTKKEIACRSAREEAQIEREASAVEDQKEEMLWEIE